ncbi:MAG: hypothetical protein D6705_02105 [Deltaproteobacteria bacterium]|nr:MAG: hypothetical protein D6705_02105 [Deltaproteobacteria bacterium]
MSGCRRHHRAAPAALFCVCVSLGACYEPVPEVDTAASTTAPSSSSDGGTSGGEACAPVEQSPGIACGPGLVCSQHTQSCCYAFAGGGEALRCDCPDTCNREAATVSEFRCDGPEDCAEGEVCCAEFDGVRTYASCKAADACFQEGKLATAMCKDETECAPIPNAVCVDSVFPEIPPNMKVCVPNLYVQCDGQDMCAFLGEPNVMCFMQPGHEICAPGCEKAGDSMACPPSVLGADAFAECTEIGSGDLRCIVPCDPNAPSTCGDGLDCVPVMTVNGTVGMCMWPS